MTSGKQMVTSAEQMVTSGEQMKKRIACFFKLLASL
jgi:hypothetical protein